MDKKKPSGRLIYKISQFFYVFATVTNNTVLDSDRRKFVLLQSVFFPVCLQLPLQVQCLFKKRFGSNLVAPRRPFYSSDFRRSFPNS